MLPAPVCRCPVEYFLPYDCCDELIFPVLHDTARILVTAEIRVPIFMYVRYLEGVEGFDIGTWGRVGVPGG